MKDRHFGESLQIEGCHPGKLGEAMNRMVMDAQAHRRLLFG